MKDARTKEVHKEIATEIKMLKESHRIEHDVFYQALEEVLIGRGSLFHCSFDRLR